ncbi:MAG: hypothetical protein ABH881_03035 [bacterium]
MIIETSKDILNLSIAFSIFGIAVFICWSIFYFAQILRQGFLAIKGLRERMKKIDEVIKKIHDKIDHSASYLLLIGEGVKKLVEVARNYSENGKKKRNKK